MELDNVWDLVAVIHHLFVCEIEFDGDAKVAADYDDNRQGEVEEENRDDEREALIFHLSPGKRAGHAKGLRAIPSPA